MYTGRTQRDKDMLLESVFNNKPIWFSTNTIG
jgi:hypothetical protein